MRAALLDDGRRVLEQILTQIPEPAYTPSPGQHVHTGRENAVLSLLGPVRYARAYYQQFGQEGVCPKDQLLGLIAGCTPGAARVLGRSMARLAYRESSHELQELAGLTVSSSVLQRLALEVGPQAAQWLPQLPGPPTSAGSTFDACVDGTGVPMVGEAVAGRAGRAPQTTAKTREFKLAALFTQVATDADGKPIREADATTYLGGILSAESFGPLVRQAAVSRQIARAARTVFLGDGAAWVWELARVNFPQAIEILDYYHACVQATDLSQWVYADEGTAANFALRWKALLYESQMDDLLRDVQTATHGEPSAAVTRELEYFRSNRARMDYQAFRQQGLFIGSGVVEAGCKRIVGQRMKNSGMHWTVPGADAIGALRCASLSDVIWDQLWNRLLPSYRGAA